MSSARELTNVPRIQRTAEGVSARRHWHGSETLTIHHGLPRYIEAIESRLHRMEALLGGLLQNDDPRASLLLGELIGQPRLGCTPTSQAHSVFCMQATRRRARS